jgi:predicted MFS family arabinose efflux permease
LDILINVDHGALPSAAVSIKDEFDMPNAKFGALGSMVYMGLVAGSLCGAVVLGTFKFKMVLVISFLGNGAGLLLFILNNNFYWMSFARLVSGFFQIFLTIYIPLYCDCFGTPTTKPIMLSFILLAGPLGLVIGYGCTGYLISFNISWRYSFFV